MQLPQPPLQLQQQLLMRVEVPEVPERRGDTTNNSYLNIET